MSRSFTVILMLAILAAWAPRPASDAPARPVFTRLPELEDRLGRLDPSDADAYLRLGEEVAAVGDDRLAIGLFARAVSIGVATGERRTAASAALALASELENPKDQRWVRSLAWSIDPDRQRPPWAADADARGEPERASPEAASMLGLLIAGQTHLARLHDSPEIRATLDAVPELAPVRAGSIDEMIRRLDDAWPCPSCTSKRFVSERVGDRRVHRLCPRCQGDPGPTLDRAELIGVLRAEVRLSGGASGSWSAALADGQSTPIADPEAGELGARLGLDLRARRWRGGRWVP